MIQASQAPAHFFLAGLGKTMLRPGGRRGTESILNHLSLSEGSRVLEVAPNMGTTAIHVARTYGCHITALDTHGPSLERLRDNVKKAGLEHRIECVMGDARQLPFADESFDAVINEAMLTMLPNQGKLQALSEYYRVLKPGGRLGTHDIGLSENLTEELLKQFRDTIKVPATPLTIAEWSQIWSKTDFGHANCEQMPMSLLTLEGLLVDEGWEGTIHVLQNAAKSEESRTRFLEIAAFFQKYGPIFGCVIFLVKK